MAHVRKGGTNIRPNNRLVKNVLYGDTVEDSPEQDKDMRKVYVGTGLKFSMDLKLW